MSKLIPVIESLAKILDLELYLVGGSVRDNMLEVESEDLDFTTPTDPELVEKKIVEAGFKAFGIGKKFGTIAFKYENYEVQITTFRTEKYSDSRKPEVKFVKSLNEDLARRDFTINALAIGGDGKFYDLFEGSKDLKLKLVRSVGEAKKRYKEDPLRMLRAIRLATVLNFKIEEKTFQSIKENYWMLSNISKERWAMEMDKILSSQNVVYGLNLLQKTNLMRVIIPELTIQVGFNQNSIYHDFNLWRHTTNVVSNVPRVNLDLRWAALLHDVAKPYVQTKDYKKGVCHYFNHQVLGADMAEMICKRLKFSNSRTKYISEVILHHLEPDNVLKIYDDAGKKLPADYIKPQVVVIGGGEAFDSYKNYIQWLRQDTIYTSKSTSSRFWTSNLSDDLDAEFEVVRFEMPNRLNSHYLEWQIQFEKQLKDLDFERPIILVGWSLGALFLVKWLAESTFSLPLTRAIRRSREGLDSTLSHFVPAPLSGSNLNLSLIAQLHLVATPLSEGDFILPKDLSGVLNSCKEIFLYHSQNDEIVSFESALKYVKVLNSDKVNLVQNPDQGHFLVERIDSILQNIKAIKP
jgi:putative nucleotidyltransferase with HDIG domain